MKSLYLCVFLLITGCATSDPVTPEKRELARQLVTSQFSIKNLEPALNKVSEELQKKVAKDFNDKITLLPNSDANEKLLRAGVSEIIKPLLSDQYIKVLMTEYYSEKFSSDEMGVYTRYFNTPLGKKTTDMVNDNLEKTNYLSENEKTLFGKEKSVVIAKNEKSSEEYWKEFFEQMSDSEKRQLNTFIGSVGRKYIIIRDDFVESYFMPKIYETFRSPDFAEKLKKTSEKLLQKHGKAYFGA